MNLVDGFQQLATAPEGVKRMRELILSLAVQGRLVPQNALDEPATVLLDRIAVEKQKLVLNDKGRRRTLGSPSDRPAEASDLPDSWAWTSLSEIGVISPRNNADENVRVSFVQMSSIPAALAVPHTVEERPWSDVKSGFTHFAEGDVGVAKITPCFENGKSTVFRNLTNGIGAGTTELHVVRPLGGVRPEYVLIFLKTPEFLRNGEKVMTGSAGQKRLPRQYFESVPFPLPPLPEQARIVAKVEELTRLCDELEARGRLDADQHARLVSTVFDALAASESPHALAENWNRVSAHFDLLIDRPEAVDALEQTILRLAVRGLLSTASSNDKPVGALLSRVRLQKDTLIPAGKRKPSGVSIEIQEDARPFEVPAHWAWQSLGELTLNGPNNGHSPKPSPTQAGVRCLTLSATTKGYFKENCFKFVDLPVATARQYFLKRGDLLIQRANSLDYVGIAAVYNLEDDLFMFPDLMMRLRLSGDINVHYVHAYLNSCFGREYFKGKATGTQGTMPKINQGAVVSMPIPIPPVEEQARIVACVEGLRALCDGLRKRLLDQQICQSRFATALVQQAVLTESLDYESDVLAVV
ncbi:restriction endonuclease subunit S [Burkholderia gladioli]|uniref:restriction endonuclease subunit S n=1 Tax=Burkholderia gladioli TaxID=28095 RepID=UPI003AFA3CF8